MRFRSFQWSVPVVLLALSLSLLHAGSATISRQQADSFVRKIDAIVVQSGTHGGTRRTPVTESEVNSWFAYHAAPLLPAGVAEPTVSIIGNGRVSGRAVVDLDSVAKKRGSGSTLDPWSFIGGRVPVTVTGVLKTQNGVGQFELESAQVSTVPVPKFLLQELLSHYSRTPNHPEGISLDDPFALPASIQQIEVGQGQAVVVQ